MKYLPIFCLLIVFACGSNNTRQTALVNEQKLLKDSVNHLHDRIGTYLQNGNFDKADAEKKQLGAVHARLVEIQASIDSVGKR